jgi:hypothetical protein
VYMNIYVYTVVQKKNLGYEKEPRPTMLPFSSLFL